MSAGLRWAASAVLACGLLSGCADSIAPAGTPKPAAVADTSVAKPVGRDATPSVPAGAACVGSSAAFSLSLVLGVSGVADPVKAAVWFVSHGDVPGYGDASSAWIVTARDAAGATVSAGTVRLHALLLRNKSWVVDGGQRCGS
jgi:hypothetical protein